MRLITDTLSATQLKQLLTEVFPHNATIHTIFLSEYMIRNKRKSANPKVGKYIHITNWREEIIWDEDDDVAFIHAQVCNISHESLINYCTKSTLEAYIIFYSEDYLLYINSDVVDLISDDPMKIEKLRLLHKKMTSK